MNMELQELNEGKLKVAKVIIGECIRRRLSQTALARRLGVTQQQVSKLENGDFDHLGTLQRSSPYSATTFGFRPSRSTARRTPTHQGID